MGTSVGCHQRRQRAVGPALPTRRRSTVASSACHASELRCTREENELTSTRCVGAGLRLLAEA